MWFHEAEETINMLFLGHISAQLIDGNKIVSRYHAVQMLYKCFAQRQLCIYGAACKFGAFPLGNVLLILDNKLIRFFCTSRELGSFEGSSSCDM